MSNCGALSHVDGQGRCTQTEDSTGDWDANCALTSVVTSNWLRRRVGCDPANDMCSFQMGSAARHWKRRRSASCAESIAAAGCFVSKSEAMISCQGLSCVFGNWAKSPFAAATHDTLTPLTLTHTQLELVVRTQARLSWGFYPEPLPSKLKLAHLRTVYSCSSCAII